MSFWGLFGSSIPPPEDHVDENDFSDYQPSLDDHTPHQDPAIHQTKLAQFDQHFLKFANTIKPHTIPDQDQRIFPESDYAYFLTPKYSTPSELNRNYFQYRSSHHQNNNSDSSNTDYDDDNIDENENILLAYSAKLRQTRNLSKVPKNPENGVFKSYDLLTEQDRYLERTIALQNQYLSQNGPNNSIPLKNEVKMYFDPATQQYYPIPQRQDLWMPSFDNDFEDDPDELNDFQDIDISKVKRTDLNQEYLKLESMSNTDKNGGDDDDDDDELEYEKLLNPLGANYDQLTPQQQYNRLMAFVFEPVIEDPKRFFHVLKKDQYRLWEEEHPEEAEILRKKNEVKRVKKNIQKHRKWYDAQVKAMEARMEQGQEIPEHEIRALNKKVSFLEKHPEDWDYYDEKFDYTKKYKQRVMDTRYIDPEFAGDLVGVGRKKKIFHPFYANFHDPTLISDLKRLPGEGPEWIAHREDVSEVDEHYYRDPEEILNNAPLSDKQLEIIKGYVPEKVVATLITPEQRNNPAFTDRLSDVYDHYRDVETLQTQQINAMKEREQNKDDFIKIGLVEIDPKHLSHHNHARGPHRSNIHDEPTLLDDPIDLLTAPLYYGYNKNTIMKDEKYLQKKQTTLQDDERMEEEINRLAESKLNFLREKK